MPICTLPDKIAAGMLVTTGRRVSVASIACFSKKPFSLATNAGRKSVAGGKPMVIFTPCACAPHRAIPQYRSAAARHLSNLFIASSRELSSSEVAPGQRAALDPLQQVIGREANDAKQNQTRVE